MSKWISKKLIFVIIFIFFTIVFFEFFFRFVSMGAADKLASYLNPFYIFSNLSIIVFALILMSLAATILVISIFFSEK